MGKLPAMPLFVDEYEAATVHLTPEEDGFYNRLLRLCWRTPGCSVPDDRAWITKHLRTDLDAYDRVVGPLIDEFFTRKKGRILQKRQTKEFRYVINAVRKKKEAGKKGGDAKALKDKKKASSNGSVLPRHNGSTAIAPTPTPTPIKKEYNAKPFNEFWETFADKRGKEPALRSWKIIRGYDAELHEDIIAGAGRYAAGRDELLANGGTAKMAQGWLTDRRWEDEQAVASKSFTGGNGWRGIDTG